MGGAWAGRGQVSVGSFCFSKGQTVDGLIFQVRPPRESHHQQRPCGNHCLPRLMRGAEVGVGQMGQSKDRALRKTTPGLPARWSPGHVVWEVGG